MGYNLNRLKQQYGLGSASKLGYAGVRDPGTVGSFNYDKEKVNDQDELISQEVQRANYDAMKAAYDIRKANYDLNSASDRAAYDNYSAQYDQRLQGAPMYANQQFANSKRVAPNTINEMYQKYLGRDNENVNTDLTQVTDAQRNQFIRDANTELAGRGIDNTGNQYMMNQMGNYYGDYLGAPVYGGGMGTPVSASSVAANIANDTVVDSGLAGTGGLDLTSGVNALSAKGLAALNAANAAVIPDITLTGGPIVNANTIGTIDTTDQIAAAIAAEEAARLKQQETELSNLYTKYLGRGIQDAGLSGYTDMLADGSKKMADIEADLAWIQSQGGEAALAAQRQAAIDAQNTLTTTGGNGADDAAMVAASQQLLVDNAVDRAAGAPNYDMTYENDFMNVLTGLQDGLGKFGNELSTGIGNYIDSGGIGGALTNLFSNNNDNSLVSSNTTDSSYVNPAATPVGVMPSTAVTSPGSALANITGSNINSGSSAPASTNNSYSTDMGYGNTSYGNEDALMDLIAQQDYYDGRNDWQQTKIDKNDLFDAASAEIDSYYTDGSDNKSDNNTNTVTVTQKQIEDANQQNSGKARGGYIKGYAQGGLRGPGGEFEVEEETVIAPDVTLEGDPLEESLSIESLINNQTASAKGASTNTEKMLKMLENDQINYGNKVSEQQENYNSETKALQEMMNNMANNQGKGPSESEKWFRIAAAMGAPTKTGSFFDSLGAASGVMSDISKERREATTAGDQVKLQAAQFGLGLLKEQLNSDKTLSAAQLQRNQNIQDRIMEWDQSSIIRSEENIFNLMSIKEQRIWETENRKTIPQTAAGLAAEEAGYSKGSPDYKEFVKAVIDRENKIAKLNIAALERKAASLTKPEIDARKDADEDIKSTEGAIKLLEEALLLSPKSYAGDWYSVSKKALQGVIDADDQMYMDSERLENLLSQGALATLKATFGGNISDGERAANLEITGAKMKTEKGRTETIRLALETMREYEKEANDRLTDILSGDYVKRTKSTR
tara:strand:- start:2891 stop:5920 length:3030 start_codon:yes stop_codon:yes gene_type:complete